MMWMWLLNEYHDDIKSSLMIDGNILNLNLA
jgi:hypothetical protein